jgi:hypothetical protein
MFKESSLEKAIEKTYGVSSEAMRLYYVPKGYEVSRIAQAPEKVWKGEIYLTEDFMISFPLSREEEVEEGQAAIVLKPATVKVTTTEVNEFQRVGVLVYPSSIYGRSPNEINAILSKFGVRAYAFRVVEQGEQYLVHDCSAIVPLMPTNKNANQKFVRLIVK